MLWGNAMVANIKTLVDWFGGKKQPEPVVIVSATGVAASSTTGGASKTAPEGTPPYTVAASQTDNKFGTTGAVGDFLSHLVIIPATTSPDAVTVKDGSTSYVVFTGGASSVSNLVPFTIPLGWVSASGAWSVTTGANVSVRLAGRFTA